MAKTPSIGIRPQPEVKAALQRAAEEDARSPSSLAEKVLVERLRANGHLPAPNTQAGV
jgi:hypothetical protein